jgi:glyoxylase-like metal-dependent hydrolase (beta-lactamase superfamily II)
VVTNYAVYAVKYGERDATSREHFLGGDPHDVPMPMDYFVWAIVSSESTVVVDTGFRPDVGTRRGRRHLRSAAEALRLVGVDASAVSQVVLTHFHYDHVGNLAEFPNARFVVQEAEMAFWTGRMLPRGQFKHHVELDDILELVRLNHDGRIRFVDGDEEIAAGVSVRKIGGHTGGLQIVTVPTDRGPLVLASDATHYYANVQQDRPFTIVADLPAIYRGFDRLLSLAGGDMARLIPGHDPLVLANFPSAGPGLEGVAARLL